MRGVGRAALLCGLAALSWGSAAAAQGVSVVARTDALPVREAAWHGSEAHLFQDGAVALTCGSHGLFTTAVDPPARVGASVTADYAATFRGEVSLTPPAAGTSVTHALSVQARMAERVTLSSARRGTRVLDAELTIFELAGTDMPPGILVRESPTKPSTGRYVITAVRHGYRIEGFYDVWLDLSLNGGRSWHAAEAPVHMWLEPQPERPRLSS